MNFILLLIPLFVGALFSVFGLQVHSGFFSGGLVTSIIVMIMMWNIVDQARNEGAKRCMVTLCFITLMVIAVNIVQISIEHTLNNLLSSHMTVTAHINGRAITTTSGLGMAMVVVYVIIRGFITWGACRIYSVIDKKRISAGE